MNRRQFLRESSISGSSAFSLSFRGVDVKVNDVDGIWVFTFPEGHHATPGEVYYLRDVLAYVGMSERALVWRRPLNISKMSRVELEYLRNTLNRYLEDDEGV
jgi:hypothetical protein